MPRIRVNGAKLEVPSGVTVAAALMIAGTARFRTSVTGEARGPLCGMGICFECRVTVDDEPHVKSCQTYCREGMRIETT